MEGFAANQGEDAMTDEEMVALCQWVVDQKLFSASPRGMHSHHISLDVFGNEELTQDMRYKYVVYVNGAAQYILRQLGKQE